MLLLLSLLEVPPASEDTDFVFFFSCSLFALTYLDQDDLKHEDRNKKGRTPCAIRCSFLRRFVSLILKERDGILERQTIQGCVPHMDLFKQFWRPQPYCIIPSDYGSLIILQGC